jgi:hypothetical protein
LGFEANGFEKRGFETNKTRNPNLHGLQRTNQTMAIIVHMTNGNAVFPVPKDAKLPGFGCGQKVWEKQRIPRSINLSKTAFMRNFFKQTTIIQPGEEPLQS